MKNLLWTIPLFSSLLLSVGCKRHHHSHASSGAGLDVQVSNISPGSGTVGSLIIIKGKNFSEVPQENQVLFFNGIVGVVENAAEDQLSVRIPEGARTGAVTVSVENHSQTEIPSFTILPSVSSVSPIDAAVGTQLTIQGFNFNDNLDQNTIVIHGVTMQVVSASYSSLTALVVDGATTGELSVSTVDGTAFGGNINILPTINFFNPTTGIPGDEITIFGSNFSLNASDNIVSFNGVQATVTLASYGMLKVIIPSGSTAGPIQVQTPDGTATSVNSFGVVPAPILESFAPSVGAPGAVISVRGQNFGSGALLKINGSVATILGQTSETVIAQVPAGATTGSISIEVGGQSVTSLGQFEIAYPRYVFAANRSDNTISAYISNPNTGELRANGFSFVGTGTSPKSLAVDSTGQFLYVANSGTNQVAAYRVKPNGRLQLLETQNAGTQPNFLAVNPKSPFLYVVNSGSNDITVFRIAGNGSLSLVETENAGVQARSLTIEAKGKFAYVANPLAGTVAAYKIETDGSLTFLESQNTGGQPESIVVDAASQFLYIASSVSNEIAVYEMNENGGLSLKQKAAIGSKPECLTLEAAERFLYVASKDSNLIKQFKVNDDGSVAAVGSSTPSENAPVCIQFDVAGKLYSANSATNSISIYSADSSTGSLNAVNLPLSPAGKTSARALPVSIVAVRGSNAVSAQVRFAYAANSEDQAGGNSLSAFEVAPSNGVLTRIDADPNNAGMDIATGRAPLGVVSTPDGKFVYASNANASTNSDAYISMYQVEQTTDAGSLTAIGAVNANFGSAGKKPQALAVDASGRFLLVVNQNGSTKLRSDNPSFSLFSIGEEGSTQEGQLTSMKEVSSSSTSTLTLPNGMVFDPSGRFAYALFQRASVRTTTGASTTNVVGGALSLLQVSADPQSNQVLRSVQDFSTRANLAQAVAVHPSGNFLYVTNENGSAGPGKISRFRMDANGSLSFLGLTDASVKPRGVAIEPTGKFLYVANFANNTVSAYSIDSSSGDLTFIQNFATVASPFGLNIDFSGNFLYVTSATSNGSVSSFAIQSDGSLISASTSSAGKTPKAVTTTATIQ